MKYGLTAPKLSSRRAGLYNAVAEYGTVRYAMCPYDNSSLVSVANEFGTGIVYRDEVPRKKTDLRESAVCFFSTGAVECLNFSHVVDLL